MTLRKNKLKKINLLLLSLTFFGLVSCSDEKTNELRFTNDIDSQFGWNHAALAIKGPAHSGKYYTKVDSTFIYSVDFYSTLANVSSKKIIGIKASAWCLFKNMSSKAKLVVSVEKDGQPPLAWNGTPLSDFVKIPDQWSQVFSTLKIPANIDLTNAYVKVFVMNEGKETILLDDFEVEFTE